MRMSRRHFVAGAAATGATSVAGSASSRANILTPEMFGAKGDGRTNDTAAFARLSSHVNANGGGAIALRPVTYIVGAHGPKPGARPGDHAWGAGDILHFVGCTQAITIEGNGARLRAPAGLHFGTFDRRTGLPAPTGLPTAEFFKNSAGPYLGMIFFEKCTGAIAVRNIELDGNLTGLVVGGTWSNGVGWNSPGTGLLFIGNSGPAQLSRIYSHHHPQDGLELIDSVNRSGSTITSDSVFEYNGRQGCSITGGRNYVFERCKFQHTGRAGLASRPGAGVDIEAEAVTVRNVSFSKCIFSDNFGFGLVAGSGDSEGITCDGCTFIGTTTWPLWADKPRMRFSNCTIVGTVIRVSGETDPERATQFRNCTFTDDPSLSPTGKVFLEPASVVYVWPRQRMLFSGCEFRLTHGGLLPHSNPKVIYEDCTMLQRSTRPSAPVGTYIGTDRISGNANLDGSIIRGTVVLNGRTLPQTP